MPESDRLEQAADVVALQCVATHDDQGLRLLRGFEARHIVGDISTWRDAGQPLQPKAKHEEEHA